MSVQPKLLTVVIANNDSSATYTTLRSISTSRYRNHEIVCVVPYMYKKLRQQIAQDFAWVPQISSPYASVSSLLEMASARARIIFCDAILFIESGATFATNTIHDLVLEYNRVPSYDLILPSIIRRDGGGIVHGGAQMGKWPHQLKSITDYNLSMDQPHFVGGVVLVRRAPSTNYRFVDSADDLALLYWTEGLLANGCSSHVALDVSVAYDRSLYCDFNDMMTVPGSWYADAKRYIAKRGTWYDKLEFVVRFGWRTENGVIGRWFAQISLGRFSSKASRL